LSDAAGDAIARPADAASLSALGLSALGVVFGDIGTSPLYTLKTVLGLKRVAAETITGVRGIEEHVVPAPVVPAF